MSSIFNKIKNKITKNNSNIPNDYEYSFSVEEISNLDKKNKEKIKELKNTTYKNDILKEKKVSVSQVLKQSEGLLNKTLEINELEINNNDLKEIIGTEKDDNIEEKKELEKNTISYINIDKEKMNSIMDKWNNIDINEINEYILKGKDLINHNYIITYGEDALKFIYEIRNKYNIIIEYLIGFNNEKNGIVNKNIFSDKIDNEWKYIHKYIKILETIKRNKR